MNPDGTGVVQVTDFGGFSGDPDWSPDGKWLAFESDLGDYPAKQGIYISRPDGSHLHRVTTLPEGYEFDIAPQFSPDGKRIVFTRYHFDDQGNETSALHVVNVDGTHETRLDATADLYPGDANWSPDGKTLVFETFGFPSTPSAPMARICATSPRGTTRGFTASADPVYSPDGRQIMLLHGEFTNDGESSPSGCQSCRRTATSCATSPTTLRRQPRNTSPTGYWPRDWVRRPRSR